MILHLDEKKYLLDFEISTIHSFESIIELIGVDRGNKFNEIMIRNIKVQISNTIFFNDGFFPIK